MMRRSGNGRTGADAPTPNAPARTAKTCSSYASPRLGHVKATWDASQAMLRESGLDNDDAYALSMVSQELLENA